jgi:hypothetical protein
MQGCGQKGFAMIDKKPFIVGGPLTEFLSEPCKYKLHMIMLYS